MTIVERLDAALKAAGLVFDGLAVLKPDRQAEPGWLVLTAPGGQRVRIDGYSGDPAQVQAVIDGFDFRARKPRSLAAIMTDVQALAQADRNKLLAAMAAEWLQVNPTAARRLGIAIDGDEVSQ